MNRLDGRIRKLETRAERGIDGLADEEIETRLCEIIRAIGVQDAEEEARDGRLHDPFRAWRGRRLCPLAATQGEGAATYGRW